MEVHIYNEESEMRLQKVAGTVPVKEFVWICSDTSLVSDPSSEGTVPIKLLSFIYRYVILDIPLTEEGIVPVRLLVFIYNRTSLLNANSSDGMDPDKQEFDRLNLISIKVNNNWSVARSFYQLRLVRRPSVLGIVPPNLL